MMQTYKSVKLVQGFKIDEITVAENGCATLKHGPFSEYYAVDAAYMQKHKPYAGGYFVEYADGYKSFTPAEPFEAASRLVGSCVSNERRRIEAALIPAELAIIQAFKAVETLPGDPKLTEAAQLLMQAKNLVSDWVEQ